MSQKNFIMGIAGNLIAAGAGWYIKGPNTGLIIAGAGIVLWLLVYFFGKKVADQQQPPVHIENQPNVSPTFNPQFNPTFSPQQNVYIGTHPPQDNEVQRENARREAAIVEFLKNGPPYTGYDVAELSQAVGLPMPEVRDIMERLKARRVVRSEGQLQAFGGLSYFLDELYREPPIPPQQKKPNTVNVYKKTPEN